MKKSLIALAVATLSTGAFAQASNVTLYGIIDTAVERYDNGVNSGTRLNNGGQSGSRLGFRGTEDLGGGLKGIFQLEAGFNADNGTGKNAETQTKGNDGNGSLAFNRQSWVGVQSDAFGRVTLGRQTVGLFDIADGNDPFETGYGSAINGTSGKWSTTSPTVGGVLQTSRFSNGLKYVSPSFSGVKVGFDYTFGNETPASNNATATTTKDGQGYGLNAQFNQGPIQLGLATIQIKDQPTTALESKRTNNLFAGTYDLGMAKVFAGYLTLKDERNAAGNLADLKRNMMWIGANAKVGGGTATLAYYNIKDKTANTSNADANQISLGYSFPLSKRTNLYTVYSKVTNKQNAIYGLGPASGQDTAAAVAGQDPSIMSFGVRHRF